jgi:hypothetical protein
MEEIYIRALRSQFPLSDLRGKEAILHQESRMKQIYSKRQIK